MINIGIVGDPIVRWALKAALAADSAMQIVNTAGPIKPDVLVMWINAPVVLEDLSIMAGAATCIAIGSSSDPAFAARVIAAGAVYYVSTTETPITLLRVIRDAASGTLVLPPEVADLVKAGGPAAGLTSREMQVMKALTRGATHREIAAELKISVKTVDGHRGNLMRGLGLVGNGALIKFAIRYGYATP